MDILVIGNGFDVAHGLPTKYDQFLDFVKFFRYLIFRILKGDNKVDITGIGASIKNYCYKLSADINKEYYELIYDNIWFKHFINAKEARMNTKQNWIDFEAEISETIQILDKIRKEVYGKTLDEKTGIEVLEGVVSESFLFYLYLEGDWADAKYYFSRKRVNKIKERLINDLNKLTRCLELYLSDYLDIDSCNKNPLFTDEIKPDYVITFNYTDTYERLYLNSISRRQPCGESTKHEKIHYIHGKAQKENTIDDCDLVLGIEEYLEGDDRQKDNEYIEFKKFYQRIYKGTGNTYTKWLQKCKKSDDELYVTIYGHSIATTDGDIIKNLIEAAATTTIYYYDKSDLHNKILNLVQIIGEEELIERTSDDSEKGSIIFMPIR